MEQLGVRRPIPELIAKLKNSAPQTFAPPEEKLNERKDLVVEGETFRWEKGKGNYKPPPKHLPYTSPVVSVPESKGAERKK